MAAAALTTRPENEQMNNDTNRAILASIFADLESRPLHSLGQHLTSALRAEEAGLIYWAPALSSRDSDSWAWSLTAEEIVILGSACDAAIAAAKELIDETAEAVRLHGHGQASDIERQQVMEAMHIDDPPAIIVEPGSRVPRVDLVSR